MALALSSANASQKALWVMKLSLLEKSHQKNKITKPTKMLLNTVVTVV